jgi:hypothetical protein
VRARDFVDKTGTPEGETATLCGFDFAPLSHPLWWAALALLLVNDNLLKGRAVVPAWLTGKLSDFAILVVAPVLLTALLPLQLVWRRVLAFLAVTSLFVAADVSPAASDAIVALAARAGLRWRLWTDLTDLLALLVLPASWRVAGTRGRRTLYPAKSVLQVAGMCIGVFACLATGSVAAGEPDQYPFVVNRTTIARKVSLTWLLRKTPCGVDVESLAASLASNDLDDTYAVLLTSGQVAALDAPPASQQVVAGVCQNFKGVSATGNNCMGVVVTVESGPSVLVSGTRYLRGWDSGEGTPMDPFGCSNGSSNSTPACAPTMPIDKSPGSYALSLVESGGQLTLQAGDGLRMAPLDLGAVATRTSTPDCRQLRTQIQALLRDSVSCATDADCQVVSVNLAIPAAGICNAYLNRSVSLDTIAQQRDLWNASCSTDDRLSCGTGQVHPPTCIDGKCDELCAGIVVPTCPATCASLGHPIGQPCNPAAVGSCLSADEQLCTCTGPNSALVCKPQPELPGCSITCTSTLPASLPVTSARPGVDAAAVDATIDARSEAGRGAVD